MSLTVGILAAVVFLAGIRIREGLRVRKEGARNDFFSNINALSDVEVSERLKMEFPDLKGIAADDHVEPMAGVILHRPYLTDLGHVIGYVGPSKYLKAPVTLLVEEKNEIALIDPFSAQEMQRLRSVGHVLLFGQEALVG